MKQVVFLYHPRKKRQVVSHNFSLNGRKPGVIERLAHPLSVWRQGVDWNYLERPAVLRRYSPSVFLRCFMQAEIATAFSPSGYEISCSDNLDVKNSLVVVSKRLMNKAPLLERLKSKRNTLLIDMVDGRIRPEALKYADGLICCSRRSHELYSATQTACPVFFVEHCVDRRIKPLNGSNRPYRACYFGAEENFLTSAEIGKRVTCHLTAKDYRPVLDWMAHLDKATLHYALRPVTEEGVFKPFTKGFIAARCNANILVHKNDGDAEYYLGRDYPYLIKEEPSEDVILDYMNKAERDFGGPSWSKALSMISGINRYTAEKTIAGQFWHAVKSV